LFSGGTQVGGPATVSGTGGSTSSNPEAEVSITTSQLPLGNDNITAQYGGDGNYAASTSASVAVEVQIGTSVTLTSSNPIINHGSSVTFTAKVTAAQAGGPGPTGTITFSDNSGSLGTIPLTNGQAQVTTSSLPGGIIVVAANYSGDVNYAPSVINLAETVNLLATTTAITTSNPTIQQGTSVTFTATVTPGQSGGLALTGTVQFSYCYLDICGLNIGSPVAVANGQAQITTNALQATTFQVTAAYSGDTNYAASSGTVAETVTPPPTFAITANPGTVVITAPGQSGSTILTFTSQGGLSGSGNLSSATCGTAPAEEMTCSLGAVSLASNGTATATLTFFTTAASNDCGR
jgi:Bacterial Ig-like domain (group 3)